MAYSIFGSGGDVYSSGNRRDSVNPDCAIAVFWKNGTRTELFNQSNTTASSIVVSGSDVYACRTLSSTTLQYIGKMDSPYP